MECPFFHIFLTKINKIKQNRECQLKGFQELKLLYGKLSINHRTLCASTKTLKEKLDHSQQQISDLMNENQTLKVRAGIAWEEMTPRPSFTQVFPQNKPKIY